MKKSYFLLPILIIGLVMTTILSCEEEPEELCGFDEFCEAQMVDYCCTGDVCVFKLNGKEYPDTEEGENQIAKDLGCAVSIDLKSTDYSDIILRLRAIKENVKSQMR